MVCESTISPSEIGEVVSEEIPIVQAIYACSACTFLLSDDNENIHSEKHKSLLTRQIISVESISADESICLDKSIISNNRSKVRKIICNVAVIIA